MPVQKSGVLGRVAGILNSRRSSRFYFVWSAVLFLSLSPHLSAQTTSTIAGTVRDKQGLTVGGAEVQVSSTGLAIDRSISTESDGTYRIAALPPGIYQIKVSRNGLSDRIVQGHRSHGK